LAHERRPGEQASGERACLLGAGAEVVERVEAFVDTRDGDPPLEVVEVVGNDEVVGNRVAGAEGAEGLNCELSLRLLLSRGMRG
jgi:hypothetical protein